MLRAWRACTLALVALACCWQTHAVKQQTGGRPNRARFSYIVRAEGAERSARDARAEEADDEEEAPEDADDEDDRSDHRSRELGTEEVQTSESGTVADVALSEDQGTEDEESQDADAEADAEVDIDSAKAEALFAQRAFEAGTDVDEEQLERAQHDAASAQWISLFQEDGDLWTNPNARSAKAVSTVVPYSLLYVLATCPELRPLPDTLVVHLLGATFSLEGRSEWGLFKKLLTRQHPEVQKVSILLNLAEPFMTDNTAAVNTDKTPENMKRSDPGMRPLDTDRIFTAKDACSAHGVEGLTVTCVYGNYQNNLAAAEDGKLRLERPTIAMMINPGLGQPIRRTWDPVLNFLLDEKITTIISTQMDGRPGRPGASYDPFQLKNHYFSGKLGDPFDDETRNSAEVMRAYGATLLSSTVSPFPLIYKSPKYGLSCVHNAVLTVYHGRVPNVPPCKVEGPSKQEREWLGDFMKDAEAAPEILENLNNVYGNFMEMVSTPSCPAYDLAVKNIIFSGDSEAPADIAPIFNRWQKQQAVRIPAWEWVEMRPLGVLWTW
mmetsp:Transcript_63194/g.150698  ORF Transcript_63194/g.150698 Transcript_63194/m.150698 type:complete len:551 (+) Transcript_63194:121-1773(+)